MNFSIPFNKFFTHLATHDFHALCLVYGLTVPVSEKESNTEIFYSTILSVCGLSAFLIALEASFTGEDDRRFKNMRFGVKVMVLFANAVALKSGRPELVAQMDLFRRAIDDEPGAREEFQAAQAAQEAFYQERAGRDLPRKEFMEDVFVMTVRRATAGFIQGSQSDGSILGIEEMTGFHMAYQTAMISGVEGKDPAQRGESYAALEAKFTQDIRVLIARELLDNLKKRLPASDKPLPCL